VLALKERKNTEVLKLVFVEKMLSYKLLKKLKSSYYGSLLGRMGLFSYLLRGTTILFINFAFISLLHKTKIRKKVFYLNFEKNTVNVHRLSDFRRETSQSHGRPSLYSPNWASS
jgi:hypothetical protein